MNLEHWLVFLPREAVVAKSQDREMVDTFISRYRVRLPGDPQDNPQFIKDAIKSFELDHGVNSWTEVAASYRTASVPPL